MSSTTRADPFAGLDLNEFTPAKPKRAAAPKEEIRSVSEANAFPSRQAAPPAPAPAPAPAKREQRRYRTGRNVQFATKVTQGTYDKAYQLVDRLGGITMGELVERAFAALEKELPTSKGSRAAKED